MKKDSHGRKKKKACDDDCESVEVDTKMHCDEDISVMKLEFQQVNARECSPGQQGYIAFLLLPLILCILLLQCELKCYNEC